MDREGSISSLEILSMSYMLRISTPDSTTYNKRLKRPTRVAAVARHEVGEAYPELLLEDLVTQQQLLLEVEYVVVSLLYVELGPVLLPLEVDLLQVQQVLVVLHVYLLDLLLQQLLLVLLQHLIPLLLHLLQLPVQLRLL